MCFGGIDFSKEKILRGKRMSTILANFDENK